MFLFILHFLLYRTLPLLFKYLSCFYLSAEAKLSAIQLGDLNTSHVFIYPSGGDMEQFWKILFKYISCFYLSSVFTPFPFYIITNSPLFFNVSSVFYQPPSLLFLSTFIFFFSPYFISFLTFFLCTTPGNLEYQTLSIFYHPVSQDFLSKNIVIH